MPCLTCVSLSEALSVMLPRLKQQHTSTDDVHGGRCTGSTASGSGRATTLNLADARPSRSNIPGRHSRAEAPYRTAQSPPPPLRAGSLSAKTNPSVYFQGVARARVRTLGFSRISLNTLRRNTCKTLKYVPSSGPIQVSPFEAYFYLAVKLSGRLAGSCAWNGNASRPGGALPLAKVVSGTSTCSSDLLA